MGDESVRILLRSSLLWLSAVLNLYASVLASGVHLRDNTCQPYTHDED